MTTTQRAVACHAYCTWCFRWARFVGHRDLEFAGPDASRLVEYPKSQPEVRSVILDRFPLEKRLEVPGPGFWVPESPPFSPVLGSGDAP